MLSAFLQQQSATANKRVSVQSFFQIFLHSPEDFSSSKSSTSVSGDDDKILVGKVSNDEIKTPFGAKDVKATAVKDRKSVIAACKAAAVGRNKERLISTEAKAAQGRGIPGAFYSVHPLAVAFRCPCSKRRQLQTRGSGDNDKILVAKFTNNKTKSPCFSPAKHRNSLSQGTRLEARQGSCYVSLPERGLFGPKPAGWPVTGQAQALQCCNCDDSVSLYNGS
jgi:hypothetical protein